MLLYRYGETRVSLISEVVGDAGKDVEGAVRAAESIAGWIQIRNRGVVVFSFHKEPPFLSREDFQSCLCVEPRHHLAAVDLA